MTRTFVVAVTLAIATSAAAQVVAPVDGGVVVARDGVLERFDLTGRRQWSAPSVDHPTHVATSEDRVAVLDAWSNRIHIARLGDGTGSTVNAPETPVAAAFVDGALFVIGREAAELQRVGRDGTMSRTPLAPDPQFIRARRGGLIVYSRRDGVLQEVTTDGHVRRTMRAGAGASDLEIEGETAYLIFPADARMAVVDLDAFEMRTVAAGGVPTDLAVAGSGNALSPPRLVVADAGAKRLWQLEGAQSFGSAFGRGFLRGLLGLGLAQNRNATFPTGIDRVLSAGGVTLAYDASAGTLYRVRGEKVSVLAQTIGPQSFTISGSSVAIWQNGRLRIAE